MDQYKVLTDKLMSIKDQLEQADRRSLEIQDEIDAIPAQLRCVVQEIGALHAEADNADGLALGLSVNNNNNNHDNRIVGEESPQQLNENSRRAFTIDLRAVVLMTWSEVAKMRAEEMRMRSQALVALADLKAAELQGVKAHMNELKSAFDDLVLELRQFHQIPVPGTEFLPR